MREVVIVSGCRTAVGKANKGGFRNTRPEDLGAFVIREAIERAQGLEPSQVEDAIIGCSFPEGEQGMNMARLLVLRAGLPVSIPGVTINRFCSSGLQAISMAADSIIAGRADIVIAGGVEAMSAVPLGGLKMAPNPYLMENLPEAYLSMGLTAEKVADRFGVSREAQDEFALQSHKRAWEAIQGGRFKEEILPVTVEEKRINKWGKVEVQEKVIDTDEGVRPETTLASLAKLKPAFRQGGSVTAGNSSQTSDAAAAVVLMSKDKALELGVKPLAYFRAFAVTGLEPEIMGVGPITAIPKALKQAGLSLKDIDLIELNEAFAAQALAVIKELGLDQEKTNVNGGAIALGHPLGCTGTKLSVSLINEMIRRDARYGIVSMCIGGGMGAAGIFERYI